MIENLKLGCAFSKDQIMRIINEDINADNVLDTIDYEVWFVEYTEDGQQTREEFGSYRAMLDRYDELKTVEEFDVMKDLFGSISNYATWRGVIENG